MCVCVPRARRGQANKVGVVRQAGSDVKNLSCEAKKTPDGKHYIVK